jgi:hypothetical protein
MLTFQVIISQNLILAIIATAYEEVSLPCVVGKQVSLVLMSRLMVSRLVYLMHRPRNSSMLS